MEQGQWQNLPHEMIQKILTYVPTSDLPINKAWVCKNWNSILQQPSFWFQKLLVLNISVEEVIRSTLSAFEKKLQVACLYHACLNEESMLLEEAKTEDEDTLSLNSISDDGWEDLSLDEISDDAEEMLKAAGILIIHSVKSAEITLNKNIHPVLPILLKLLAIREVWIYIYDYFGFWNFSPRYDYSQMLKGPKGEAKILTLIGCVATLNGFIQEWDDEDIPEDIAEFKLSIAADENNKAIDPSISSRCFNVKLIHIKAGVDVSTLKIGDYDCSELIISGLEESHIPWMISTLRKLKLHNGYSLTLFDYRLDMKSTEKLFYNWRHANVEPVYIMCASTILNAKQVRKLNDLAAYLWIGCEEEYLVLYKSNEKLRKCEKFQGLFYIKY